MLDLTLSMQASQGLPPKSNATAVNESLMNSTDSLATSSAPNTTNIKTTNDVGVYKDKTLDLLADREKAITAKREKLKEQAKQIEENEAIIAKELERNFQSKLHTKQQSDRQIDIKCYFHVVYSSPCKNYDVCLN